MGAINKTDFREYGKAEEQTQQVENNEKKQEK